MNHTPGPYRLFLNRRHILAGPSGNGRIVAAVTQQDGIGEKQADANAAFIIRALNSHDDMVAALKALADEAFQNMAGGKGHLIDDAYAAIAKATKGKP